MNVHRYTTAVLLIGTIVLLGMVWHLSNVLIALSVACVLMSVALFVRVLRHRR